MHAILKTAIACSILMATELFRESLLVAQRATPTWGESPRLVEEVRIGVLDGDEEYMFGNVYSAAIGSNGTTLVADYTTNIIRMYDRHGRFLKNVGRGGEGPGEYRSIGGLGVSPDGRISVFDNRIQRLTTYSAGGVFEHSTRVPSGLFSSDIFRVGVDGTRYVRTMVKHDNPTGEWTFGWIRVSRAGQVLDTIVVPNDPFFKSAFVITGPSGYDRPFDRELVWTMTATGALAIGLNVTNSNVYTFDLRKAGASISVKHPYVPVPIVGQERKEWEAMATRHNNRAAPSLSSRMVAKRPMPGASIVTIPNVKPAFSELRADSEGRVWVRRYTQAVARQVATRDGKQPARTMYEPPVYDVFDASGAFVGSVTFPMNSNFMDARGNSVLVVLTEASGEEVAVRYRVVVR